MSLLFTGVRLFDGRSWAPEPLDVVVDDDHVSGIGSAAPTRWTGRIEGGVVLPGLVDAHAHLALADPWQVARAGVTGVLDLGAPLHFAIGSHEPLRYRFSGPMLTSPGGYPIRTWGAGGFGLEVATVEQAAQAASELIDHGATVVKIALEPREGDVIPEGRLRAIVDTAHARGVRVVAHAVLTGAVCAALDAGVDILAHVPVERLDEQVVADIASRGVAVISTICAQGATPAVEDNARAMAEAGVRIVYGTNLGMRESPYLDIEELRCLAAVTGSEEGALRAATTDAAEVAGVSSGVHPGAPADLVWLPSFEDLADLKGPKRVWIGGREVE
ncbi:MAG TPA: amidohydrolase family protein [Actinomycetota bacterium]|nr:amidohydrolase family protein [Actinomycetota bacterium]